jgi:hypothetical protein
MQLFSGHPIGGSRFWQAGGLARVPEEILMPNVRRGRGRKVEVVRKTEWLGEGVLDVPAK